MATYLPSTTDYIPQIQPFSPDLNFLGNVLQTKQSRYDTAHKQLGSIYGSLLNSPMSRETNINKRNEFFKQIDGDIKKVSGLDLSLQQNQDYAEQIFTPLTENKDIVKDMTWTKQWQDEVERGENFKSCIDTDKCGGQYWDGGMEDLQYQRQDFMKASDKDALTFATPQFVPGQNVMDKALKTIEDSKFKVKYDIVSGGYITTTTNGTIMTSGSNPLASYLTSVFGTDQSVKDFYEAQARVERRRFVTANADKFGGEDGANQEYLKEFYANLSKSVPDNRKKADKEASDAKNMVDAYSINAQQQGISKHDFNFVDEWNSLNDNAEINKRAAVVHKEADDILANTTVNAQNPKVSGSNIDKLVGYTSLTGELKKAASIYANLTMEETKKVDPIFLAKFQSDLSFRNASALKEQDFGYKIKEMEYKQELEDKKWSKILGLAGEGQSSGTGAQGTFEEFTGSTRGTSTDVKPDLSLQENTSEVTKLRTNLINTKNKYNADILTELKSKYDNESNPALKQAILTTTKQLLSASPNINAAVLLGDDTAKQKEELDKVIKLPSLQSESLFNSIDAKLDPSKSGISNKFNWINDVWNSKKLDQVNIKRQTETLNQFSDAMVKNTVVTNNKVKGDWIHLDEDKTGVGEAKVSLFDYITTNSSTPGFFPDKVERYKLAADWAKENTKQFPTVAGSHPIVQAMMDYSGQGKQFERMNQYHSAYEFALRNLPDMEKDWKNQYALTSQSWMQAPLDYLGKASNAKTGGGMQYRYDMAAGDHPNNMQLVSLATNFLNLQDAGVAKYGDASTYSGDPDATTVAKKYLASLTNPVTIKDKDRPMGIYSVQRIAAYDDKNMAFTIHLPDAFIEKQVQGMKSADKLTKKAELSQPITLFIPSDKANNTFWSNTELTPADWKLSHNIPIKVDEFPGAGNVSITSNNESYIINYTLKDFDEHGKPTIKSGTVYKPYNTGLSGETLQNIWTNTMQKLELRNQQISAQSKAKGYKNINQAYTELSKQLSEITQ